MSTDTTWQTSSASSEQTESLAASIGQKLKGGEVIELKSDLGGGKTTFVRGLAHGAGSTDHVSSPTFKVCNIYRINGPDLMHLDIEQGANEERTEPYTKYGEGVPELATPRNAKSPTGVSGTVRKQSRTVREIWHYDFYRLHEAGLMQHELAEVLDDPQVVTVVEWGDVVADVLPTDRVTVNIHSKGETDRNISISCPPHLAYLLENIQ